MTTSVPSGRPKLSAEIIIQTALKLIDRDGLAGLSMRRLAAALGVEVMTLYYYVPKKAVLLDQLVAHVVLANPLATSTLPDAWIPWIRMLASHYRTSLLQHPKLIPLIATHPPQSPQLLPAIEHLLQLLMNAGFTPLAALHIVNSVIFFVIGHTLAESSDLDEDAPSDSSAPDPPIPLEVIANFPCLQAAWQASSVHPNAHQARFDYALDALITGFAQQLAASPQPADGVSEAPLQKDRPQ